MTYKFPSNQCGGLQIITRCYGDREVYGSHCSSGQIVGIKQLVFTFSEQNNLHMSFEGYSFNV